jgi:hypothetical protein
MENLFASGRVVDIALAVMALELAVIAVYRRKTGKGPRIVGLLANFAAGAGLLLALRASLTGTGWSVVAVPLAIALGAHLLDLRSRWPRAEK